MMRLRRQTVVLVAFACSGAAALSYEVLWTRSLSVVLGSTTHALSSMLATFMLGLALGGLLGGRIADRRSRPLAWLGACELGIGLLGIASHVLVGLLPEMYLFVYRQFHLDAGVFFVVQIGICSLVMLGPTVLMGMTFPLATKVLAEGEERVGSVVGRAYGVNTLGSVVGSIATGFFVLPALGIRGATLAAAAVNLAAGVALVASAGGALRFLAIALLYVPALVGVWRAEPHTDFVSIHTASRFVGGGESYDEIRKVESDTKALLFAQDGVEARVAAYRTRDGHLVLHVGGKVEGTADADETNALLLSYLPVAAHAGARSVLVVGLGAGVTLDAARRLVPEVDLVEISDEVIEVVRRFGPPGALEGVTVHRADARNHLFRTERRYDVISSEPSYPSNLAVSNLFTADYYEIAAARLNDGGVYCQWLPYYLLTNDDVTMMVKTFASVFPYATVWKVPSSLDLLLLGSRTPFVRSPEDVRRRVAALGPPRPLEFVLSRDVAAVAQIARRTDVPINTDDLAALEFSVARNLRVGNVALVER